MNKTIVVTGGTKGIGRAIVEKFAKEGFLVITCARSTENDLPDNVLFFQADLSKKAEVLAFANFVKSSTPHVDVLVNNTGYFLPGQIHNEEEGTLETMIETNLYSAYNLTRALVGDMITQKAGYIFNICSVASIVAYTNGGSYCISKFAMLGMSKVLREELKPYAIRVTSILPGATFTNSWAGVELPTERFIASDDIATVIWTAYSLPSTTVLEEIVMRPQLGDL
ncbi:MULTISPECIES: SDR family oxidoreductase [unclassified Arcicella]|uniref:SDR family oxidoreductase n=1 Tax=unclassified Arcicella TaxID=2644986 RepID=UPI0028648FF7|nr:MULTISPECIES: SDR family oxidoreductase [unclassified Arcicella]MDR6560336.1 NADP-dependent 3-hydroxy acid dehydrogenase YdfG [Arcicella sp. BE51]MDR6810058.1 NADP-dependent 3-hydroxy acid dehydrogenase YdfG [Arcicella sp. BE140]MDR6821407.1 NADP-dependent 3-hydroxy acid dehydrogenase YdfG [Arcicella sp. BE139]